MGRCQGAQAGPIPAAPARLSRQDTTTDGDVRYDIQEATADFDCDGQPDTIVVGWRDIGDVAWASYRVISATLSGEAVIADEDLGELREFADINGDGALDALFGHATVDGMGVSVTLIGGDVRRAAHPEQLSLFYAAHEPYFTDACVQHVWPSFERSTDGKIVLSVAYGEQQPEDDCVTATRQLLRVVGDTFRVHSP